MDGNVVSFLKRVYPIQEFNLSRDRPLEVLALGPGRSGTESLREALQELGYRKVHHGYVTCDRPGECPVWLRFFKLKSKMEPISAVDFDKVIGDCSAVTDFNSAAFAIELAQAYPNAKVILNRRTDLDAWSKSYAATIIAINREWWSWFLSFWDAEFFWFRRNWEAVAGMFGEPFEEHGKEIYEDHFRKLQGKITPERTLVWAVEDGWSVPAANIPLSLSERH